MPERKPDQTVVSVSMPRELLARIDARAGSFDISRSQYVTILARKDLAEGGTLVLPSAEPPPPVRPVELNAFALRFLKHAVPALTDYQHNPQSDRVSDVPEKLADSQLWHCFHEQRAEILRQKWIASQKAGFDIGPENTLRNWLQEHKALWVDEAED